MEGGGASSVLAIADSAGIPLEPTQKELTPLQRMVITLGTQKMHEEAESGAPRGGGHGSKPPVQNSLAGGGDTISGDTVTYVNEGTKDSE